MPMTASDLSVAASERGTGQYSAGEPDDALVIGVALDIPSPWREQLAQARLRFDDPSTPLIPPHITLLPPTTVPAWQCDAVMAHLARVAEDCPPFDMRLRGTATFRPVSPVVFVAVVDGISGCERLERGVRSGVLLRRRQFPYHPNVTVAHDVPDEVLDAAFEELDGFSARFRAESFTVSQQGDDGTWSPLGEFALRGAALGLSRQARV